MSRNERRKAAEIRRVIKHRDYRIYMLEGIRYIKARQLDEWNRVNTDPHLAIKRKLQRDLDTIDAKILRIYSNSLRRIDVIQGLMDSSSSSDEDGNIVYLPNGAALGG